MREPQEMPRRRLTHRQPRSSLNPARTGPAGAVTRPSSKCVSCGAPARYRFVAAVVAGLLAGGCAARVEPPGPGPGAEAPPAAVERFLRLAAEADYGAMGWLFGTSEGPILERDAPAVVERRMHALATLLTHDTVLIGPGSSVPGRAGDAVRFEVELRSGANSLGPVSFVVVSGLDERWFVEELDVIALTRR